MNTQETTQKPKIRPNFTNIVKKMSQEERYAFLQFMGSEDFKFINISGSRALLKEVRAQYDGFISKSPRNKKSDLGESQKEFLKKPKTDKRIAMTLIAD